MDTNAKRFKYSIVFKILCVAVSFVCFFAALQIGLTALATAFYISDTANGYLNAEAKGKSAWTANDKFARALQSDVYGIWFEQCGNDCINGFNDEVASVKREYVEKGVKLAGELKEKRAEYESLPESETSVFYGENENEYENQSEQETTTFYHESDNYGDDLFTQLIVPFNNGADSVAIDIFPDDTAESISARYDESAAAQIGELVDIMLQMQSRRGISRELSYYSEYGKAEKKSADFNEQNVNKADIYYIVKDGNLKYKGIDADTAQEIFDANKKLKGFDELTVVVYLNISDLQSVGFEAFINNKIKDNSLTYSQLYDMYNRSQGFYGNTARCMIVAGLLLLVSICAALMYFEITGRKNTGEPAKKRIYDFVPFELGLALVAAVIAGVVWAVYSLVESMAPDTAESILIVYILLAASVPCWIALFAFCASNARYFCSGKKWYGHFLTYLLIVWLGKAIRLTGRGLAFVGKKSVSLLRSIGSVLFYKPKKFVRNVIMLSVLLVAANLAFAGLTVLFAADYSPIPAFICAIIALTIDGYVFYRVLKYIKNLDEIIDASSRHEDILTPLEKLDNSLRVLALNMKYSNSQLQAAINKAVKDERLRTELITNVSHDLKTPLTSIILYVDMLSKCDINDEKAKEYIEVLNEKGNKLKKLIDDLIEASKVTSGNVTVNPTNINLSELCLQATVDAQSDFEKAGLELIVKSGEKQTTVFADGAKTNRIIENLLSNARKYSAKASRVYVSVYEEQGRGIFEIKNVSAQPLDITPDELTERFVRGDKSRNQEGNGLGLSIAKELCTLQNGELDLQIDGDLFKARVCLPQRNS